MQDQMKPRRLFDKRTFHEVRGRVANWALLKVSEQWDQLVKKKDHGKEMGICSCTMVERYTLPYQYILKRYYNKRIPIPITLIYPRWWYNGPIEERVGW